jgi:hydrogenase nickel insertion protein HypA
MHETSIASSILQLARQKLQDTPNAQAVTKIVVLAGEFRNVDADSLLSEFDSLKVSFAGCEKCALRVDMVAAEALCADEEHRYHPTYDNEYCCPMCGRGMGRIVHGKELDVLNITLAATRQQGNCPHQRHVR